MARVACDIAACTHSADWAPLIAGMDAVVNCAGALPSAYHRLFGPWFACGFPAIAVVLAIFRLMLIRPPLW